MSGPTENRCHCGTDSRSNARRRYLSNIFRTYSNGLMALAVIPPLLPIRQQPLWAMGLELCLSVVFALLSITYAA
jgi:hypothetical protein